jgi:hypothetical protein
MRAMVAIASTVATGSVVFRDWQSSRNDCATIYRPPSICACLGNEKVEWLSYLLVSVSPHELC